MDREEIDELMEYNLEYLEARNSEDIFGGDYTSQVDLKYANKEIDRLQQENKQLKDNWNKLRKNWEKQQERYQYYKDNRYRHFLIENLKIMQELETGDNND